MDSDFQQDSDDGVSTPDCENIPQCDNFPAICQFLRYDPLTFDHYNVALAIMIFDQLHPNDQQQMIFDFEQLGEDLITLHNEYHDYDTLLDPLFYNFEKLSLLNKAAPPLKAQPKRKYSSVEDRHFSRFPFSLDECAPDTVEITHQGTMDVDSSAVAGPSQIKGSGIDPTDSSVEAHQVSQPSGSSTTFDSEKITVLTSVLRVPDDDQLLYDLECHGAIDHLRREKLTYATVF